MKRCFAVMLTAVFLIAVLASPALAAETYVIEFSGDAPSLLSFNVEDTKGRGWAQLNYVIPEGFYSYEYTSVNENLEFQGYGSGYLSISYVATNGDLGDIPYLSQCLLPVSFSVVETSYDVNATVGFYSDCSSYTLVLMQCGSVGPYDSVNFLHDGAILTLTPVSEYDVVSSLFGSAFNMMISNPLTTTLTAAGLVGVGVTVYTKVKKTARR